MSNPSTTDRRALLMEALSNIERLKAKLRASEAAAREPIAVVGAACRFPSASSVEEYWQILADGRSVVREVAAERRRLAGLEDEPTPWYAGLVDGIDEFDPRFFNISAREAATMDPQQRMVLEVAWEALEASGQNPAALSGSLTGVFIGITGHDYGELIREQGLALADIYTATGNASNAAAGRLSFVLGFQGPSVSIDTACSSSLVSIHLACQSLRSRESNLAIAGGVNAVLTGWPFQCFSNWGMMAPDGRCKAFDAGADGFVRGEGCGLVVLKRLSEAVADGDRIWAVIRGSAVNQDGRSSGLTVPNGPAQEAVIRQALERAGVAGREIDYVEAHGTGTSLGDPIEAHALAGALGEGRERALVVGSVKTNLGHLESAAGVAGLIKVVLSLQAERIPAHLHFERMNPHIDWRGMAVEIPVEGKAWKRGERRRLAGVSSFGFSGTNAHVIVEEAPAEGERAEAERTEAEKTEERGGPRVVALSGRTAEALAEAEKRWAGTLERTPEARLEDVGKTANEGRAHFAERSAVVAGTVEELRAGWAQEAGIPQAGKFAQEIGAKRKRGRAQERLRIGFLFSGQGAQYAGMGRELYEREPAFREVIEECERVLAGEWAEPLREVLWGSRTECLDQTQYTQPALFAVELGLAAVWRSWGIEPAVMVGHSIGEYVAVTAAGGCTLAEGLRLVAERGRLMGQLVGEGAMAAVQGSEAAVWEAVREAGAGVSVAAVNAPDSVVVSGYRAAVEAVAERMRGKGYRVEPLRVSHGFHSPQMEAMVGEFERRAGAVPWKACQRTVVSSVTGQVLGREEMGEAGYWGRQVREAVQFRRAMETLAGQGIGAYVEIGPGTTLLGLGRLTVGEGGGEVTWVASLRRSRGESEQMAESLAELYVRGAKVDWRGYEKGRGGRWMSLPAYPFQRQRYWIDAGEGGAKAGAKSALATKAKSATRGTGAKPGAGHPLLGERIELAGAGGGWVWQAEIDLERLPWLGDHVVQDTAIFPATAYLEMAAAAGAEVFGGECFQVRNARFHKPMFFGPESIYVVQARLAPTGESEGRFEVHSRPKSSRGGWTLHMTGDAGSVAAVPTRAMPARSSASIEEVASEAFYGCFAELGNNWGPAFRGVVRAGIGKGESWSELAVPESIAPELSSYHFHPALADASGHVLPAIRVFGQEEGSEPEALVGHSIAEVVFHRRPSGGTLESRCIIEEGADPNELFGSVSVYEADGTLVSELKGAVLRYIEVESSAALDTDVGNWIYEVDWQPVEATPVQPGVSGTWMVLADAGSLAEDLCARIEESGGRSVRLSAGSTVREALHSAATSDGPVHVVYLGGLDAKEPEPQQAGGQSTKCWELVKLAREISSYPAVRLHVITKGAQLLPGDEASDGFWQAPLWGLGRTMGVEFSENWAGLVDLDPGASAAENAEALWRWLCSSSGEDQAASRGGRFSVARLVRRPLAAAEEPRPQPDGAYLITGGFGGLGAETARWLVRSGARNIVLVSRTVPAPRASGDSAEPGSRQERMLALVRELEGMGARVDYAALDVGNAAAVRQFVDEYTASDRPPLRGVVHTAGVLSHGSLQEATEQEIEALLRPKLAAWNLHQAMGTLDFLVLFSSASAVIPSPRLGAYAAGNAFLDGLACYRAASGLPALSINWGVWADAGMVSQFENADVQAFTERGMKGMKTAEGLEALGRLMSSGAANRAVLPVDWVKWAKVYPAYTRLPIFSSLLQRTDSSAETGRPGNSIEHVLRNAASAEERLRGIVEYLRSVLGDISGFPASSIAPEQPVTDLGIDSLTALELKNRIHADTGVSLPMVHLLEGRSIAQLAGELAAQLAEAGPAACPQLSDEELLARLDTLSEAELDAALSRLGGDEQR